MLRTVLGHATYQIIIIFTLLHKPKFIPNGGVLLVQYSATHLSVMFNVFVFMQVFNEINSRKINDERNVFDRIFSNKIFIGVIVGTILTQVKYHQYINPNSSKISYQCIISVYQRLSFDKLSHFAS